MFRCGSGIRDINSIERDLVGAFFFTLVAVYPSSLQFLVLDKRINMLSSRVIYEVLNPVLTCTIRLYSAGEILVGKERSYDATVLTFVVKYGKETKTSRFQCCTEIWYLTTGYRNNRTPFRIHYIFDGTCCSTSNVYYRFWKLDSSVLATRRTPESYWSR